MEIKNIISEYKSILQHKNDIFSLLVRLKQNVEFNSTIDWKKIFTDLGDLYKDPKPYYINDTFTPDPINSNSFTDSDIFVFGSNTEGKHNGGAAKVAMTDYGAVYEQPRGLQGNSYGIVTIDFTEQETVTFKTIENEIDILIDFALENPELRFWVTKIGCGISGFSINEIAPLFKNKIIPGNIILPEEFVNVIYDDYLYDTKNEIYYGRTKGKIVRVCVKPDSYSITERPETFFMNNLNYNLNIIKSSRDEFINATEHVLKELY